MTENPYLAQMRHDYEKRLAYSLTPTEKDVVWNIVYPLCDGRGTNVFAAAYIRAVAEIKRLRA